VPHLLLSAGGAGTAGDCCAATTAAIPPADGEGAQGVEGERVLAHGAHLNLAVLRMRVLLRILRLRPVLLAFQLNKNNTHYFNLTPYCWRTQRAIYFRTEISRG
jgi:hypothetical protein